MKVKQGDKVKVDYTGTFEDGEIFDTSEGRTPLEFTAGSGQVVKGFDEAVIGMEKGEEKEITLKPEEAYGNPNPDLIKKLPKEQLPEDAEVGSILGLVMPNGQQIPAKVTEITNEEITLDLNHPLAGKVLKFKIKVVEIS
ncbi:peptidylprolyl isomerase [Candidatus Woesearchaeota archaeon]|nr:peptidylprolyl isomerase [Candidatus Woesearchaeota archaeon]